MDHDYELEEEYAPRILWGRLAFFLLALVLTFVAGRACAPNGVSQDDYNAARAEVVELASEKALLEEQLRSAGAASEGADGGGNKGNGGGKGNNNNNGAGEEATEAPSEEPIGEGQTYTVKSGDTLTTIAEQFYGDATLYTLIVDANNLDDSVGLRVGQELIIPPND